MTNIAKGTAFAPFLKYELKVFKRTRVKMKKRTITVEDRKWNGGLHMKKNLRACFFKIANFTVDLISFLGLRYMLVGCKFAFQNNAWYIFFFTLDIYLICKFWEYMKTIIENKVLRAITIIATFALLAVFVYYFGYIDIEPALRRW